MSTDAPPPTRRALRAKETGPLDTVALTESEPAADAVTAGTIGDGLLVVEEAAAARPGPIALVWVDEDAVARRIAVTDPDAAPPASGPGLLARAPRRSPWRPGVLVPIALLGLLAGGYAATTLLWPLHAVAPQVEAAAVQTVAAPVAAPAWPAEGGAAISVAGIDGSLASDGDVHAIASITKLVTALVVLDRMPLAAGEAGPDFFFTAADRSRYWQYRDNGESALDVPVGGSLTEHQMLEGMLIGSANNYADRLASALFPSDAVFADAAEGWLGGHGVAGVTVVDPTGIEEGNTASPQALIALAERAMANPVIAEIVGRASVELPGAGTVENTNDLLADPGVVGLKTGTLDALNLLAAKDVAVGDTTVRMYASVLGQPTRAARDDATRALFARMEQELQLRPSVAAGTVVGEVTTRWGEPVDVVTDADASVVLWNGGSATTTSRFDLGDTADAGEVVGALTVSGPLDSTSVDLRLAADVEGPSPWWRLTHPLDLFGLD